MKRTYIIMSLLFFALAFGQAVYKTGEARLSPRLLNYQGYLTDTLGNPITNPSVSMIFSIFDAASTGNQKWSETQATVAVDKGIFHVLLGAVTPIPDSVFNASDRWLELSVAGQVLSPRTRIVSAAYAVTSTRADTALYAKNGSPDNDWIRSGGKVYTYNMTDSVGIATSAPRYSLDVNGIICGGTADTVKAMYGSVLGGIHNIAGDEAGDSGAVVCGGYNNSSKGQNSFIGGGSANINWGYSSTISGGKNNLIISDYSVISGGSSNKANVNFTVVCGGAYNTAQSTCSSIGGGAYNYSGGDYAVLGGGYGDTVTGTYATVGGGRFNCARGDYSVVVGGGGSMSSDSNSAIGLASFIGGGNGNVTRGAMSIVAGGRYNTAVADYSTVGGGNYNIAQGMSSIICGGYYNTVGRYGFVGGGSENSADSEYAAVSGGYFNNADMRFAYVGGGDGNCAFGSNATVGGGSSNTASGDYATVAGGIGDYAAGLYSTISGGFNNFATGLGVSIGGGEIDSATGYYSTVPGGYHNTAAGRFGFAAGRQAKSRDPGTFVWADSTAANFVSTGANQFLVRASGGVGIMTNSPTATLDVSGANGYNQVRMRTSYTPTGTADANGNVGDIAWDVNYVYVKTAAGWKRSSLSTW